MKVERNSYALSLKKWKFDVKNCEVEVIILVKRNAAFHDFYSERHSNLCGKLVNFRTLCNCYIIPMFLTALFIMICYQAAARLPNVPSSSISLATPTTSAILSPSLKNTKPPCSILTQGSSLVSGKVVMMVTLSPSLA